MHQPLSTGRIVVDSRQSIDQLVIAYSLVLAPIGR